MSSRRNSPKLPTPPSATPEQAIALLKKQITKAQQLTAGDAVTEGDRDAWENTTRDYLVRAFGSDSRNIGSVMDDPHAGSFPMGAPDSWWMIERASIMKKQIKLLESCIEQLETEVELRSTNTATQSLNSEATTKSQPSKKVFIVHGRNDNLKNQVTRYIENLDLTAIILHEQPNEGRTIIEKFEAHANETSFAIVLLTADDVGGLSGTPQENMKPRARQNVIFELGYFFGLLKRKHVCALYEDGVELLSDINGIAYVPFDSSGAWRSKVASELKAAGIEFNYAMAFNA